MRSSVGHGAMELNAPLRPLQDVSRLTPLFPNHSRHWPIEGPVTERVSHEPASASLGRAQSWVPPVPELPPVAVPPLPEAPAAAPVLAEPGGEPSEPHALTSAAHATITQQIASTRISRRYRNLEGIALGAAFADLWAGRLEGDSRRLASNE